MADEEKEVRVTDSLMELYSGMDAEVEKRALPNFKISCSKGCAHCCYLLAVATFAEALLIAERLLARDDWREWVGKLKTAAIRTNYSGINKQNYFEKGHPCVFLGEDKLCQIYEFRPAACRYHFVISPPENCSYLAPRSVRTGIVDLIQAEEKVWELSAIVVRQLDVPEFMSGPIALLVLACMQFVTMNAAEDPDIEIHSFITTACKDLKSPIQWMLGAMPSLTKEELMEGHSRR